VRRDFRVAILLGLSSLPAGVALMAAQAILTNVPRWVWVVGLLAGIIGVALLIGAAIAIASREKPKVASVNRYQSVPQRFTVGFGMVGLLILLFFVTRWFATPVQKSPGFAAYAVVRLYDTPENRRRYVFEFTSVEGAKSAFYLSASGQFTFTISDVHGEAYPLEVRVGRDGIPIDEFVVLFCEAGIQSRSTALRILVNGKEVARRIIPEALDLGTRDWKPGSLGAPIIGENGGGVFLLSELGIFSTTLTDAEIGGLVQNVRNYMGLPLD
jgi:hypothetical protein